MDAKTDDKSAGKCPFTAAQGPTNRHWWPHQLDLQVLHRNSTLSDPMDAGFDYAKEFKSLDLNAVIKDLHALLPGLIGSPTAAAAPAPASSGSRR
jgi:catalase-peroxidase